MSIKSQGGVFGRNPTFNDVTVDGDLSIAGTLTIGGETITGLSYQGGWNASTNTPDIAASSPVTGQFWIVSADGSTDVGGITNWTQGDWALYDGSAWQRVEGGNTDLSTGVQGQLAVANGGTGAADAATARTNLGLGTAATTASTDYATAAQGALADSALQSSDIGVSVQGYDATILTSSDIGSTVQGYDANILTNSDIGSTVQGYDADTTKNDVSNTFTADQTVQSSELILEANNTGLFGEPVNIITFKDTDSGSQNNQAMGSIDWYQADTDYVGVMGRIQCLSRASTGSGTFVIKTALSDEASVSTTMRIGGNNKDVIFYDTSDTEYARFQGTTGNLAFASGNGIDFSATSGTGTSELFDDYEEGTWTPTAIGYSGTMTVNNAIYTKIGNIVYVAASVTFDGTVDASAVAFDSFPFSKASNHQGGWINQDTSGNAASIGHRTQATVYAFNSSGGVITYTAMGTGTLKFAMTYIAL